MRIGDNMRTFLSLVKVDIKRAIQSIYFLIAIIGSFVVMLISSVGFISDNRDVIQLLGLALSGSGSLLFILCIAPILPYGMSFAVDADNKTPSFWFIRTGVNHYATSKFIVAAFMGFLSIMITMVMFVLVFSIFLPLHHTISTGDVYAVFLENERPIFYLFVLIVHYALTGALFAGIAMMISTFITDTFSVLVTPIVLYFFLLRVMTFVPWIPQYLKPGAFVDGIYDKAGPMMAFLYKLIPVVVILVGLLIVTMKRMKRRMGMI